MMKIKFVVFALTLCCACIKSVSLFDIQRIHKEILSYAGVSDKIIKRSVFGKSQNQSYDRLAVFTDKFGSRLYGSRNLENSIDYMLNVLKADGLDNVHGEEVTIPHWVRGNESVTMLQPRHHPMAMLGLGGSIATPPGGITAEALVVKSFDELHKKAAQAKGKIIVYNEDFITYGISVAYREHGAVEAARVGGVATLIRSVASFSIDSPHTGIQDYNDTVPKIPTACISIENAEMLHRMSKRGEKIVLRLKMEAKNLPPVKSRNTVAEITGSKYPEQVVLVSGHLDSWDVGQGAMDDGGGAFISWQALSLIRQLGLRPKRTMRMVMWTAEEPGHVGAKQYWQRHKGNVSNYDLVMESDGGTFTPTGIAFTGNKAATSIMKNILGLVKSINASGLTAPADQGDVAQFIQAGVPGGSLNNKNDKYFYFHHSNGDMMTVQNPHVMDLCSALWAVVSYVVADMDEMLPRDATV